MSDIQTKLVEVITQLQSVVKDNAGDAVNLGLSAIRITGIQELITSFVLLGLSVAGFILIKRMLKKIKASGEDFIDCPGMGIPAIIIGIAVFSMALIAICGIFNIWTYVAIFEPKLWLAHQVIAKFGG